MKKVVVHRPGGYDRLTLETCADPSPEPGELLIGVEAAGVNYADCLTRMGLYSSARHYVGYPITPGFEVAGRILAPGGGVQGFRVGDPVMALTRFGAYAQRICCRPEYVFPLPSGYSIRQAAAFPVVFLTAWLALFELVNRNRSVLAFSLSYLGDRTDLLDAAMPELLAWAAEGRLVPPPVTVYPFDEVGAAHRALESGTTQGKLVLDLGATGA